MIRNLDCMNILSLKTLDEIGQAFDIFLELRTHLISKESFIAQVIQQQKEGYKINAVIENDEVMACIGFRIMTMLA